jgi:hypothetical protein
MLEASMERPLPSNLQNAVEEFVRWRDRRKARYQTELQPFFHYTDESGLEGILRSDTLWFTHVEHLNDPSEYRLCYNLAVGELKCAQEQAGPVARSFLHMTLGGLDTGRRELPMYIGSFSRSGDDLGQWRSYADNARGFCLQVSEQVFLESNLDQNPMKNHLRIAIRYDAARAQRELKDGVRKAIKLLEREDVVRECEGHPNVRRTLFVRFFVELAHWIDFVSVLFKHPAYQAEQEVRLLLKNTAVKLQPYVRTRTKDGKSVPYIPWPFQPSLRQSGVLQLIRIGPAAPPDSERAVKELLRSCGISSPPVVICRSQIPYRVI